MFAHFFTFLFLWVLKISLFCIWFLKIILAVVISNFIDPNSYEHVASKSSTFERAECESLIKEPLLKSHFLDIDKKRNREYEQRRLENT
jgi:hypothetical protein